MITDALRLVAALTLSLAVVSPAEAQPRRNPADPATWTTGRARDYRPPDDVAFRTVTIISEGVPLHAELFAPKARPSERLPTIITAHGWGGTASGFRQDAVQMARAGLQVLTFDYRGWGESGSRVVLTRPEGPLPPGRRFTAEVEAVRGYVDPSEQAQDWFNVLNWAAADPSVDPNRIGVRGSSFSGGTVVHVAAHDDRVKALVSQVGSMPSRPNGAADAPARAARASAAALARGQARYPEPAAQVVGSLVGAPIGDKMLRWWPGDDARQVTAPALFIVAEGEDLFDNRQHAVLAHERVRGPKRFVSLPGKHYDIYGTRRAEAVDLAIDWFKTHLR